MSKDMDKTAKYPALVIEPPFGSVKKQGPGVYANRLAQLGRQRWKDFKSGALEYLPSFPETPAEEVPEGLDPVSAEFFSYYGLKRGHHPHARGGFATTSMMAMMNFRSLDFADQTSARPILMFVDENAHSK